MIPHNSSVRLLGLLVALSLLLSALSFGQADTVARIKASVVSAKDIRF